ncbi:unnamed protein product (macronuclear) [Paramecium tetraurelia]|uniref:Protein kinase domain-containing protein n=1 Tax=Paramecium tetraurelia TaxID=5888 RepID=A0E8Y1_PARTE|nr:uncharacterized protein GSPATT00024479001 [Paramecium tetraurelia]CAK91748.1 unnamed protein product [Paramecium tetraurelia]|eukprot:XP_001459145.1 hypothetical protein (macronuclear) [Paramecium tetraurelia strain d4-2]
MQQMLIPTSSGQTSLANNANILYECIVERHHFFLNRKYYLQLTNQSLTLSEKQNQQDPKYIYQLKIDKVFTWSLQNNKIVGFQLPYQDKIKDFFGNPNDMVNLKAKMGAFVCYEKIEVFYKKEEILQTGSFGKVTKEICRFTSNRVAIKSVKCQNNQSPAIKNEIEILKRLKQSNALNILEIKEVYKDELNYYIVTEYIPGSNLKQHLDRRNKPFTMQEALSIMEALLKGLQSIHQNGIIHRDLKPANLMYHNNQIKIIDFGLACLNGKQLEQYPSCGTAGYSAPEVLNVWNKKQAYDFKVDLFSAGCILYKLLTLDGLFNSENEKETFRNNKLCQFTIKEKGSVFDLVQLLVKAEPQQRLDCCQAMEAVQALLDYKYFDVNTWYANKLKSYQKGRSQCEFNQEPQTKLSRQCSLTSIKHQEPQTERQRNLPKKIEQN